VRGEGLRGEDVPDCILRDDGLVDDNLLDGRQPDRRPD
jgi:hypothetical protein